MIRTFRDEEGKQWRVWQVVPQSEVLRTTSPDLARGWLCFENDGEKKRLVDPPNGWQHADDTGLCRLLSSATFVKQARVS